MRGLFVCLFVFRTAHEIWVIDVSVLKNMQNYLDLINDSIKYRPN